MADSGGDVGGVAMPQKLTEHVPQVNWRNRRVVITIVGCGGTGSQIATGMPYLHRSEEHTSDSSHLGISYAVFCLKKKKLNSPAIGHSTRGGEMTIALLHRRVT